MFFLTGAVAAAASGSRHRRGRAKGASRSHRSGLDLAASSGEARIGQIRSLSLWLLASLFFFFFWLSRRECEGAEKNSVDPLPSTKRENSVSLSRVARSQRMKRSRSRVKTDFKMFSSFCFTVTRGKGEGNKKKQGTKKASKPRPL